MTSQSVHGTSVEIKGEAVLIKGNPGAGKSSLALQLIDRGALLIADDQTNIGLEEGKIVVSSPDTLKGLLEVRGLGLISYPYKEKSPLGLCVEICDDIKLERLPEPLFVEYYDHKVPLLKLKQGDPLGAIKIELKVCKKDETYFSESV